jgi:two-component system, sporulation sensor kinase D
LSFLHALRSRLKTIIIYILITVIPTLAISYSLAQNEVEEIEHQYKIKAQEYANYHAMNIENFLGETIGRLEMLATALKIQHSNLLNIESILNETQGKDPRFSGLYWVTPNGDLLISTNPITTQVNVSDRSYFQEVLEKGNTSISEAHIGRVTGRFIITIATPIFESGKVQGVLMASLRIDEIEAAMRQLTNEENIKVTDPSGQILIDAGKVNSENRTVQYGFDISQVPWTVTAMINSANKDIFHRTFIKYMMIFLTLTNILFLLVQNLLLRKRVIKEREQTELHKLELIGNLAASTAHEIRNPLTGIKGLVKLLSEEHHDKKSQTYFEVIQQEVDRINVIVSELLVLGKPTAYALTTCNANEIIKEIEPIIHSEANFMNVQLSIYYTEKQLPISCVKDHLKQVILNLSKNSLQAMPYGGKLTIITEEIDNSCVIRVLDNGIGMQKEQLKQAFKPFYTLKKDGSGLGLTVCKRIIETYNGHIMIESVPDQGTQVEIILPLSMEKKHG